MSENRGEGIKKSLRVKIFRMNIELVAAAVIIFTILGIIQFRFFAGLMEDTNQEQNTVIMETMSEAMREMATESFQKYVLSQSNVLDREFWTMRHDLEVLARQVQMLMQYPSSYSALPVRRPSARNAGTLSLQLLYSDDADQTDRALTQQIMRIGNLQNMILEIVEKSDILLDCMVSLPGGASIIADRDPEGKIKKNGEIRTYNADRRPWYVGAVVHGDTYFTPVNKDNYTDTYEVMAGVPVYVNGKLAAVCGASLVVDKLEDVVLRSKLGDLTDTCLINETGNIIISTRKEGELSLAANELKSLKSSSNPELAELIDRALDGKDGFSLLTIDGVKTYVAYAPVKTIGWTQLLFIPEADLNQTAYLLTEKTDAIMEDTIIRNQKNTNVTTLQSLVVAVFLLAFAFFVSSIFAERLVKPIKKMTMRISQMHGDDMVFPVEDVFLTSDEIEVLAKAFSSMSQKMQGYVREIVNITAEKQRLDTELSVASEIQANMLPKHFPAFPDRKEFDLYAVMDPAKEVGGDFYDFFLIDEDHLALVMADVSGKGVPAALFMVISKTLIKNVALSGIYEGPGAILSEVNNRLCEGNEEDMFVTVWLGILTISTGHLISACAGHEYPVFYWKDKGFTLEKDPHGTSLGAIEDAYYREVEWKLDPGDLLFLYTDGVPEATNNDSKLFGNDRMLNALSESWPGPDLYSLLRGVRNHVDDYVGDAPQFDDLTMMCLEYRGKTGEMKN
ncbi:MAG: SpoIIE family protein phosphatase [Blautia sp.]|nr:SpoIIE family protein phosphatase [Blautia sp.]